MRPAIYQVISFRNTIFAVSLYNKYISRIKVKDFDPIKATTSATDERIDISKVTAFTSNQSSGKSTVAKLVSTFT